MFAALQVVFWLYSLQVKSVQAPICISLCHAFAQPTRYNPRPQTVFDTCHYSIYLSSEVCGEGDNVVVLSLQVTLQLVLQLSSAGL